MADTTDSYRAVTPYLVVPNADALLTFAKRAFDARELRCDRGADGSVMHAEFQIGDSLVMLGQAGGEWPALTAALYLWMDDVDARYRQAIDAGATSQFPPEDKPYGHRNAGVVLQGVTWWIGAPVRRENRRQ